MCQFVVNCAEDCSSVVKSQPELPVGGEIGERLRAERKRLGFNQTDMAHLGGVSLNTQNRYEAGGVPATEYLLMIGKAGADWYWILTGNRISVALQGEAAELLRLFMQLPSELRPLAIDQLRAVVKHCGAGPSTPKS